MLVNKCVRIRVRLNNCLGVRVCEHVRVNTSVFVCAAPSQASVPGPLACVPLCDMKAEIRLD